MQTQSSDDIMRETENTRAGIEKNLDALEDRLAPGEVLDQIGRAVEPARDGAARFARNLGDTVREHPVPAAMVGIGLGWLLLSQSRSGTAADRPAGRVDPSRPADRFTEDPVADGEHPGPGVRARQAREWARERAEGVRDSVGERAEDTYRRVSDTAHRAGARAGDTAAAAGNFVQRRPILTGVAVAGLGAVIAAALFARTDRGERLVSRAADAGRDAAHRMGETVRSAAETVSEAAAGAVSEAGERVDDVKEKARSATGRGRDAARSRTGDRDWDTDPLKPAAVRPQPVSPPNFDFTGGDGDGGGDGGGVRPGSRPGTTQGSNPVPPNAGKH